jgi:hypothetical protein
MKLTESQRRTFFAAIRPAAAEVGENVDDYRHQILHEELGVDSLSEVSRGAGFDKLMARIWRDRGDYAQALKYSQQSMTRVRYLLVDLATRIVRANGHSGTPYAYLAGVMVQAKMVEGPVSKWAERLPNESAWLDFTEPQLRRLLMMLNTYIRRH